ncbi:MAG: Hsp20/alpha crystallin family protein [bacterium]|nr:Hsp20/alpha crystallin family protein [bacterium]
MVKDPFDEFFDEINRFIARFFEIEPVQVKTSKRIRYSFPGGSLHLEGNIPVAIIEGKDYVKIVALLPGVEKKDINVEAYGSTIEISAKKRQIPLLESEKVIYTEFPLEEELYRRITIPYEIDEGSIKASFNNGILVITANKTGKSKGKKISVE